MNTFHNVVEKRKPYVSNVSKRLIPGLILWHALSNGKRHDLREIGMEGANWIRLAQDRVQWRAFVDTVMNLRVPRESRIFFDKLSDIRLFKYNVLHDGVSE
jgi:hypothetical protein